MSMQNVLFIVNSLRFGGAEKHVVSLINNLNLDEFNLSLSYLKPEEDLLQQIHSGRLQSVLSLEVGNKLDIRAIRQLADHIDNNHIDVVVCTNTYSMFYGILAKIFSKRRPSVLEVFHSTILQGWKEKLKMLIYRPFFRACSTLVYVCENQRSYWRGKGLRAVSDTVIYNGIDIDHFVDNYSTEHKQELRQRYGFGTNDYVVGICAALGPEKVHTHLLEAISRLHGAGVSAKCLLIGDGVERTNIEQKIVELGLEQHVAITGFQPDVRAFIAACDVMTLVSVTETFSISSLESMALGKPMVMSRVGGADEQIKHGVNGYLFDVADIDGLAEKLAKLAQPEQRIVMGINAKNIVASQFSLAPMVKNFTGLLSGKMDRA